MPRYQYDLSRMTIGDYYLLSVVVEKIVQEDKTAVVDAIRLMKRFAIFDFDSLPMEVLPVLVDDFVAAFKKLYPDERLS